MACSIRKSKEVHLSLVKTKLYFIGCRKPAKSNIFQIVERFMVVNGFFLNLLIILSASKQMLQKKTRVNKGISTFCIFNYDFNRNESLVLFSFGNSFTSLFPTGHIILIYKHSNLEQREVLSTVYTPAEA